MKTHRAAMARSFFTLCIAAILPIAATASDCVILLHGLIRTPHSMAAMTDYLDDAGFTVANTGYPSRDHTIEDLAPMALGEGIAACRRLTAASPDADFHIVTHSLGGILTRVYLRDHPLPELGRVVMLGPPNQGSEVVDNLRDVPGFDVMNGPAGAQLGTDPQSVPRTLGPVHFELGVIAGTGSLNPLTSTMLPDADDGKVSVAATRVEGMKDFIMLPVTHTFMMRDSEVLRQTLHFLTEGHFDHDAARAAPATSP
jgi:pimeloyl-ACP methyl ester carboxylesterase